MPIYVYRPTTGKRCDFCENGFDQLQKVDEPALKTCPECGNPVAKAVTAPNLASQSPSLTEKNLGEHGFTKYRKLEKGVYEKTVGPGPDVISDKRSD